MHVLFIHMFLWFLLFIFSSSSYFFTSVSLESFHSLSSGNLHGPSARICASCFEHLASLTNHCSGTLLAKPTAMAKQLPRLSWKASYVYTTVFSVSPWLNLLDHVNSSELPNVVELQTQATASWKINNLALLLLALLLLVIGKQLLRSLRNRIFIAFACKVFCP